MFQLLSLYRAGQGHFAVQYRGRDHQARKSSVFSRAAYLSQPECAALS
jgi:hypothetical protein